MNLFICFFFFFNDTATTEIYTLSLHDALPISTGPGGMPKGESNKFVYDTSSETGKPLTTHQFYDGKQHPWEFKRVWHLEPSLTDADTVYGGIEDAAIFRSSDGAQNWKELSGLRGHGTGPKWQPGAGG